MTIAPAARVTRCTAASRALAIPILAAALIVAAPGVADAQQRVLRRSEIDRALRDAALAGSLLKVGGAEAEAVAPESATVRLEPGQVLAVRVSDAAVRITDASAAALSAEADAGGAVPEAAPEEHAVVALPFRYLAPAPDGGLVALRPVYVPNRRLRYDADEELYRGSFYLALEDTLNRGRSQQLAAAIRLQLAGDADSLRPATVSFAHTNFPLQEITVATRHVTDSLRVRIIPEFDLSGVDVWLPIAPSLVFESRSKSIAGFGIGSTRLALGVRGSRPSTPVLVTLDADRGTVEPGQVELGPDVAGSVRVRSAGVGPVTVRAFSPELGSAEIGLDFTWPLLFLLAALLGGGFGGLTGYIHARRAKGGASVRDHLLTGVSSGVLAAIVYYALGVNLLDVQIDVRYFDEAAVFAFAALAGVLGLPVLGATAKRLPKR